MSPKKATSLQDPFLNLLRKEHIKVAIFLITGVKLQGRIDSFDQFVILLKNDTGATQMVYKHGICTVVPDRAINFVAGEESAGATETKPA